jgi:D-aminopeptidase
VWLLWRIYNSRAVGLKLFSIRRIVTRYRGGLTPYIRHLRHVAVEIVATCVGAEFFRTMLRMNSDLCPVLLVSRNVESPRKLAGSLGLCIGLVGLLGVLTCSALGPVLHSENLASALAQSTTSNARPRASDLGLKIGVLPSGPLDAITDVAGVEVGQTTIIRGDSIRTGVTAIVPHSGNLYREKVPGGIFVGNGFGKLAGSTQVDEMGDIETPILLTSTTSVPLVANALISYMLALPGNEDVLSINPVVGETNDGYLSDIRGRHISADDVVAAVKNAKSGAVEEGAVGAGTGTVAFGWKGGIGTSSRRLPGNLGGYTVGVLVQTNFGGVLTIAGAPVGQELGQYYLRKELEQGGNGKYKADGSCMMVIATDAPLDSRNLKRLAARSWLGLARTEFRFEWQRRLRDCILDSTAGADPRQ